MIQAQNDPQQRKDFPFSPLFYGVFNDTISRSNWSGTAGLLSVPYSTGCSMIRNTHIVGMVDNNFQSPILRGVQ